MEEKKKWNEIEVGNVLKIEVGNVYLKWVHTKYHTIIWDEADEPILELEWLATEKEIEAAAYGYYAGEKAGISIGKYRLQTELKKLLGFLE